MARSMDSQDASPGSHLDRRTVLASSGVGFLGLALLSGLGLPGCTRLLRLEGVVPTSPDASPRSLTLQEWRTLAAAQEHFLPSTQDAPGASDVNGIGYLDAALAHPDLDPADVAAVKNGAGALDRVARDMDAPDFAALSESRREEALRQLEQDDEGDTWLRLVLTFTLEALLGDPVYGGNPDGVGWRWLEHSPGFPRPTRPYTGNHG